MFCKKCTCLTGIYYSIDSIFPILYSISGLIFDFLFYYISLEFSILLNKIHRMRIIIFDSFTCFVYSFICIILYAFCSFQKPIYALVDFKCNTINQIRSPRTIFHNKMLLLAKIDKFILHWLMHI